MEDPPSDARYVIYRISNVGPRVSYLKEAKGSLGQGGGKVSKGKVGRFPATARKAGEKIFLETDDRGAGV